MGRFINADSLTSTGHGLLGNNMFTYCLNNPVRYADDTGHWAVNWDLYSNNEAGREFTDWYISTDENEVDETGKPSFDAKMKRTINTLVENIEFSAGIGQGYYAEAEIFDCGLSLGMYGNYATINYSDGTWFTGQEICTKASISATQWFEVGFEEYSFMRNGKEVDNNSWEFINDTVESWTIFSAAGYFIAGGSIYLGYDVNTCVTAVIAIWE